MEIKKKWKEIHIFLAFPTCVSVTVFLEKTVFQDGLSEVKSGKLKPSQLFSHRWYLRSRLLQIADSFCEWRFVGERLWGMVKLESLFVSYQQWATKIKQTSNPFKLRFQRLLCSLAQYLYLLLYCILSLLFSIYRSSALLFSIFASGVVKLPDESLWLKYNRI